MAVNAIPSIYRELLDYLAERATPEEILAFRVSPTAQERANELTERNKAGHLTTEEAIELEQMLEFDALVSLLKSRVLPRLKV